MKRYQKLALVGVVAFLEWAAPAQAARLCERWQQAYSGDDATGTNVMGLWMFRDTRDGSAQGRNATLQGAVIAPGGKFGPCLESFRGYPLEDKRHAAVIPNSPGLTPPGAFTLELWIQPKPEMAGYPEAFLVDKKYVAHTDYQLVLGAADATGQRRLSMRLGFGQDSETYVSSPALYATNEWCHIAFTYDGAGTGSFYRNGAALGGAARPGRAGVAPGPHPLSIGDRIGSLYHGFPGFITQVRICRGVLEFRPASVAYESDRNVFVRMEPAPALEFSVVNRQRVPLNGASVVFSLDGAELQRVALPALASGQAHRIEVPFDTSLRPGEYAVQARLEMGGEMPGAGEETFPVTLTARKPPRMPVVMWGIYGAANVIKELPRLKEIGFTHCLGFGADMGAIYDAGKPAAPDKPENVAAAKRMLNTALANDLGVIASLSPGRWAAESRTELRRIGKNGNPPDGKPSLCAAAPELRPFCFNVGASVAQAYGKFPAWQAALLHTEVRDGADVCYHEHDRAACRQATGQDYPAETPGKRGVDYTQLKDFPADRVIPDDHPLLRFLAWYWQEGDGWNRLNTELHRGLKSTGRPDLWTFHDPAVRVASVYGSGGQADVISQWTYSYPDPIRIGLATDELLAMARGADHPQRVMKMTQIIWYRSQTAPVAKGDEVRKGARSPWEDTEPDAAFLTIAPMHLREAFWTKLARPVQGIMYHGWGSLVPDTGESAYRYTHPQTRHELRRLIKAVVEPLGPTLLQVPDRPADVAFLESFASQMFARRGTYGWGNGWAGDAYQALLWARLQPEIVFDETVARGGLDRFRILVMMDCDVLTARVVSRVRAFQQAGGIVVADERLCPAITADVVIPSYTRTRKADQDRAALIAKAAELRAALGDRYQPYSDSSTPDIVTRCRAYGNTDYLFAVNDQREFGDYVGQHGLVMENGLPTEATLSLARPRGHVYDLVAGRELESIPGRGTLQIRREFGPGEGCVLMVTAAAIAGVRIEAPRQAVAGQSIPCGISVVDADGQALNAVVPLQVEISDPAGAEAEWSGFHGARDGRLQLHLAIAPNDRPGLWRIYARELASGRAAAAYFRVEPPAKHPPR